MKIISIIITIFLFTENCYAQQEPQFTMFWNNYSIQNPSASGLFYTNFASVVVRNQWAGFPGSPKTLSAIYDHKLSKINSGVGINYVNDQIGFEKNNKLNINYSYHLQIKEDKILSSGLSFGVLRKTIDFSQFKPLFQEPLFYDKKRTANLYDLNLGVFYKSPHLILGLSVTQLTQAESQKIYFKNSRNYFLTGSLNIPISTNFDIMPGLLFKSDVLSSQLDLNILTTYKQRLWGGLSFRRMDAIAIMGGVDVKGNYRIGYSYDYTLSALSDVSNGSHEIVLALILK